MSEESLGEDSPSNTDLQLESCGDNLVLNDDTITTVDVGTIVKGTTENILETTIHLPPPSQSVEESLPLIIIPTTINKEITNNSESPPSSSSHQKQEEEGNEVAKNESAQSIIIQEQDGDPIKNCNSPPREIKYTENNDLLFDPSFGPGPWSCHDCTYLNFTQAPTCFQCNSPNPKVVNAPLKISELEEFSSSYASARDITLPPSSTFSGGRLYENICSKSSISCDDTGIATTIDWSGSTESEYNKNKFSTAETQKWACGYCTYENWPAAASCVMCLNVRGDARDTSNNNRENNIIVENNRLLSESIANSSYTVRLRNREKEFRFQAETRWLDACRGVVNGNSAPIEEFLARGGDPTRSLTTSEVAHLNRPSSFDVGYTLVHLALRFQQQDVLAMLLSHLDGGANSSAIKRSMNYVAPDLDHDIRNHVMGTIRYGKGSFRCNYSTEIATFTLPSDIDDLAPDTQEVLYDEILDRDVQKELESGQFINWSVELTEQLNSRLYALWNRSAGDCLLDSVLQATWGIFDKGNELRKALATSLRESASLFYQRWRENEILLSHMLDFSLNENQCATDWDNLLDYTSQPGSSLEQLHIFALAHIFRRPIIVYSVKFVKSYLGETLGYARYEGVYLPLLWEKSQCWKCPIALGYTRGHFSALVPQEPDCDPLSRRDQSTQLDGDGMARCNCTYLPLQSVDGNLLPIHYLSQAEVGNEEQILGQWLDLAYTNTGILAARQRIQKRPLLVAQLCEEWLNHYRQMASTPYMRQTAATCYSSDGGDSDND